MTSSQNIKQYIRQSYNELAKAEKVGDFERCLKTCSKILKYTPNDVIALQCKVVTLTQLQKFDDALFVIKKNSTLHKTLTFEKAYCEYRLNRNDEALKTLTSNEAAGSDFRCQELLAQLLYRTDDCEKCIELYADLLKNSDDDFDEERRANMAAVVSQFSAVFPEKNLKYTPVLNTYEQYFNEGCRLCSLGQYSEAVDNLTKAEELCMQVLAEDDASDEDILDEVCCIRLQKAYCQQMMGASDDALKTYVDISKQKPSDITLAAVAANNIVSLKKESNLFDARKKMKSCQTAPLDFKLNNRQKEIICFNSLLVNLHSNQLDLSRKSIEELKNKFGAHEMALLCECVLFSRQKDGKSAINLLENFIDQNQAECSTALHFALTQLYLNEGKTTQAFDKLNSLTDLKTSPGVLSLLVTLCLANDDLKMAVNLLTAAIDWLEKNSTNDGMVPVLLDECASLYAEKNDFRSAANYLENLRKTKPSDVTILARLINTYLRFDAKKAEEVGRNLPQLERLTQNLDVDSLENAEVLLLGGKYGTKKAAKTDGTPKPGNSEVDQKKKRKRRKIKLPKKFDPNVPPDSERWLPKFERSTYKKRKDKRAKDREIGRGTQGAVSGGSEFDIGAKAELSTATSAASPKLPTSGAPPPIGTAPGPRQQRPLAQKPKKKKKAGGKW